MTTSASGTTGSIGKNLRNIKAFNARLSDSVKMFETEFRQLESQSYIHLAALTNTNKAEEMEELSFASNVLGAIKAMEAFANTGGVRFIFASTSHIYGVTSPGRTSFETDLPNPLSVYAKHKLQAEQELLSIANNHNIELVIARIFSVFGPDMANHYLAAKVYDAAKTSPEYQVFPNIRNGLDVRDFLSPYEVAESLKSLATTRKLVKQIEVVNICSGQGQTVSEKILEVVPSWPTNKIEQSNSKIPYLVGSATKLESLLEN